MLPIRSTEDYVRMMWRDGPVAMSIAGGLYLMLFQWSANLGGKKVAATKFRKNTQA
jgi:hypothetical protein